jgi:hypothetical protein
LCWQASLSTGGTVAELDSGDYVEDYDYSGYEEGEGEDFDSSMMEGVGDQTKGRRNQYLLETMKILPFIYFFP